MKHRTIAGIELAFVDEGQGQPLLFVHGYPLDHTMWQGQIDALRSRCRVIAPDLRGFGRSGATPGTVSMRRMADDLAGLLDALGIHVPIVLGGLSMGGYVAFEFQQAYAQRVAALILCDTRAGVDTPEVAANRLKTAEQVEREGPQFLVAGMLPKLLAPSTLQQQPQIVQGMAHTILTGQRVGIAAASRGMAARADMTGRLPAIACPTLVVVGAEDGISPPAEMRKLAAAMPAAQVVEIPQAGHMSPLEQPQAVNLHIEAFLATLGGAP